MLPKIEEDKLIDELTYENKMSTLVKACKVGDFDSVKYLVSQGADVRAKDDCAVRWASEHGHLEVVKYLVSQGASTTDISEKAKNTSLFVKRLKRRDKSKHRKNLLLVDTNLL